MLMVNVYFGTTLLVAIKSATLKEMKQSIRNLKSDRRYFGLTLFYYLVYE